MAVLIQGEIGVGKELFARAIHGDEERNGPFVAFNCGATTKELIGSERFGPVRGAYTGATNVGRAGRFHLAHGGTLCVDEIGELPLELQPVLLRALEEGVVCRLGESKPRDADIDPLTLHFSHSLAERHGVANRCFGPDVVALLHNYTWPGNVRELRNVVESLLLTSNEDRVRSEELSEELLASVRGAVDTAVAGPAISLEES